MSVFQYEEIPGTLEHINELMVEKEVRQPSIVWVQIQKYPDLYFLKGQIRHRYIRKVRYLPVRDLMRKSCCSPFFFRLRSFRVGFEMMRTVGFGFKIHKNWKELEMCCRVWDPLLLL
jgi:hypothetical protein